MATNVPHCSRLWVRPTALFHPQMKLHAWLDRPRKETKLLMNEHILPKIDKPFPPILDSSTTEPTLPPRRTCGRPWKKAKPMRNKPLLLTIDKHTPPIPDNSMTEAPTLPSSRTRDRPRKKRRLPINYLRYVTTLRESHSSMFIYIWNQRRISDHDGLGAEFVTSSKSGI